jgi:glycosyltransferase involved in cell wall biosynthesis
MKIIQILPELYEGGVERGTVDLNRELVARGHESIVLSNGGRLSAQIINDGGEHITIDVCSKNLLTTFSRVKKLKSIIRQLNPDILHARSRVPAWLVYFASKSLNIPFVTTVHGFNSVNFYSKVMTYGDQVICVSNAIKQYIIKNYNTSDKKITVIPRGIDLEKFSLSNLDQDFIANFQEQYSLKNRYIVTTVGRITQLKDIETFIKALHIAKQDIKNITGLIVGGVREDKQAYFESLQKLVDELGLNENIIFTGSQTQVVEIYHLSNVVVSSSKKPESFGRSAAEALAMNTPVIATNHGGILDIVLPNKTGWLFEVGSDTQLAQSIVASKNTQLTKLREFVETNFTLKNMVDRTIEVYKSWKY